jgi:hypothetical protein
MRHYQKAKNLEKRRDVMAQWGKLLEKWGMTPPTANE